MENYDEKMSYSFEPEQDGAYRCNYRVNPGKESKPKKKHTGLKITALLIAVAIVAGLGGAALSHVIADIGEKNATQTMAPADGKTGTESEANTPNEPANYTLSEKALPKQLSSNSADKSLSPKEVYAMNVGAVCGITTQVSVNVFGQVATSACSGSGFVLTENGYIVTNNHVVEDATSVSVQLFDGTEHDAQIIGTDPMNDVALLKIDAENLQHVSVGDSDKIEVGEQVIAIGNPLGELTFTMTVGYISALDREINIDGTPINMMQTDAAINSGNSGGPLFDMNGNVIGITTAKSSGTTSTGVTIESINFAIPINDALRIVYDLQEYGYVRNRPYLGITLKDLDSSTAKNYGLPVGPIVQTVTEGSCTEKAGMQPSDIILALDDTGIGCYTDLVSALNKHKAGDTVTIRVYRGGNEIELSVTLDERPKTVETATEDEQETLPPEQEPNVRDPKGDSEDGNQFSIPMPFGGEDGEFSFEWPFGDFFFGFGG